MKLQAAIDKHATPELLSELEYFLEVDADSEEPGGLPQAFVDAVDHLEEHGCARATRLAIFRIGLATGQWERITEEQYNNISVFGGSGSKAAYMPKIDGHRVRLVVPNSVWVEQQQRVEG